MAAERPLRTDTHNCFKLMRSLIKPIDICLRLERVGNRPISSGHRATSSMQSLSSLVAESRSHSRSRGPHGDHQRRVGARSIHRGCARPSCAGRTQWRWAARHAPSSHRPPLHHDLPCSRHSVSLVAQSCSHTAAPTAVTINGESIARSTAAVPDQAALDARDGAGQHNKGGPHTARHRTTIFRARGTAC